jgi:septal ring factor EnvC (AmiA/AmiB activator)
MSQFADLPPQQIAALKKQLEAINARLLSLERERHELKNAIAHVRDALRRIATPIAGARGRPSPQPTRPRQPLITR